jgi:hypothetical protein
MVSFNRLQYVFLMEQITRLTRAHLGPNLRLSSALYYVVYVERFYKDFFVSQWASHSVAQFFFKTQRAILNLTPGTQE